MTNSSTKRRTYQRTHPWISFAANLERAPVRLWLLLGEAKSKCEHISQVPLKPKTQEKVHAMYLVKGVAATTAIEGNTLTEEEVAKRREGKLRLPPSKEYLGVEVDNILGACNWLLEEIAAEHGPPPLSADTIKEFNRRILANLEVDEGIVPGDIRRYDVGIALGRYRGAPPEDCQHLLDRLCGWLNSSDFDSSNYPGIDRVSVSILGAIIAHLYLAWIHPFGDGNGRTARLVELLILLSSGIPSPAAHLLSNHYNQTRSEYYRQLQRASQSGGDIVPFLCYALQGLVDGLHGQLAVIRGQQLGTIWREYVYEQFEGRRSPADGRRRDLVLELSTQDQPVPLGKVHQITPRIASAYARKSSRTLSRDLKVLEQMGLLSNTAHGVAANRDQILAFLPVSGGRQVGMVGGESIDESLERTAVLF